MPSQALFSRNVKAFLETRGLRLKDLAKGTQISASHLSLVLNGAKGLSDDMKDRIASFLGVPLSVLYSEELPELSPWETDRTRPSLQDRDRMRLRQVIDTFLDLIRGHDFRAPFYLATGMLNDTEARTVRNFLATVIKELQSHTSMVIADTVALEEPEKRLLAACHIAGPHARSEWVLATANLTEQAFIELASNLQARGLITLAESTDGYRVNLSAAAPQFPLSCVYTQDKIKAMYLTLARAMEMYPDSGPFFQLRLARCLLRAGLIDQASFRFEHAARLFEKDGLFTDAADAWHKAALLRRMIENRREEAILLCEAARCMVLAGEGDAARALGSLALSCATEDQLSDLTADLTAEVCLRMGHAFFDRDPVGALRWYRQGLKEQHLARSYTHGALLCSSISCLIELTRLDAAEQQCAKLEDWFSGQDSADPRIGFLRCNYELLTGIIHLRKRKWVAAKQRFLSVLQDEHATEAHRAAAHNNLGMILYREGRLQEAKEHIEKGAGPYVDNPAHPNIAYNQVELAKIHARMGELEEAETLLRKAEQILNERNHNEIGWIRLTRSSIFKQQNKLRQAISCARQAFDYFRKSGDERDSACAALWLSKLLEQQGDLQESRYWDNCAFTVYQKRRWDLRDLRKDVELLELETASLATAGTGHGPPLTARTEYGSPVSVQTEGA
ncbi:MAG TPA: tetratricopeptide repeat protein [Firmicutes bacterium]|nr:tetratricopeptide repeat protein [Candidatus Fermentithermobacillaceae bacterium]